MINYGKQTIDDEDINKVVETLKRDFLTTGPKVKEFENKFANYVGSKYAVAVSNGTAALHLACLAADLAKGDELITSPMTFAASANCALYCGAKPVFVDIHLENGLIDEEKIEEKITDKTKIIIPVHYTGNVCDLEKIKEVAKRHNLLIIEDAAHALGASYKETKIGDCTFSDMAIFSFHPVKHITTGEGGMITTNSKEIYNRLLKLRTHGITKDKEKFVSSSDGPWYHEMQELGYNYRLNDIQSALGISQLSKIKDFVKRRRAIAKKYRGDFQVNENIEILKDNPNCINSYHLFVIKVKDGEARLKLFNHLRQNGINPQVHYIPVYMHPYYQKLGFEKGICHEAEEFYKKILSIPIYPEFSFEDQNKVIKLINDFFEIRMDLK